MAQATWPYIVGDIHGCLAELLRLEERIARHAARHGAVPRIVSVGDLVDRGPDSAGVVAHFRAGLAAGTHAAVAGNHEHEMLRVLAEQVPEDVAAAGGLPPYARPTIRASFVPSRGLSWGEYREYVRLNWLGQGGAQTLASFGVDPRRPRTWHLPPEDLAFLTALPLVWDGEQALVTHALARADEVALARRVAAEPALADQPAWIAAVAGLLWRRSPPPAPADPGRWHVSGHTPLSRPKRWRRRRALQIDTGCVYGRRLTAWCPAVDAYLSVAAEAAWRR
jgi:serine/threonine protein phosphatase 1